MKSGSNECNPTSWVWGGVRNLTPLPCEGRETFSDRPSAQAKYNNEIKYGKEDTIVNAEHNGEKH